MIRGITDASAIRKPESAVHSQTYLGTLGGSHSRGQFVTEAGAIIGVSGVKGHRTHAFVWTEAGGMVEMPSLGRLENVDAASRTGAFTGFTLDKK